ncbi:hypothetical protein K144316041_27550 [Clostridium tetani]|uniref:L,D-TPase catalytic domain-containing protein n=1 Tax=Clostridium tetani TaxID=1513 RepID=A0A4Q0VBN6_CLOTA|nr:L,D-transpeptidase [Clostridium tetani]RXI46643.1 hypothetical protein DP130_10945 [Clostridium tetani]BDR74047.1 hypothetical protein K144316041_27550 [Clostridium tetani]
MTKSINFKKVLYISLMLFTFLFNSNYKVNAETIKDVNNTKEINKVENTSDKKEEKLPLDKSTLLNSVEIKSNYNPIYNNRIVQFEVNSNYNNKLNYRALLHSKDKDSWQDVTSGYTLNRNGNEVFQVNLFNVEVGDYELVIFAKTPASEGKYKAQMGDYEIAYDDYKSKEFTCLKNGEPDVSISFDNKTKMYEGASKDISVKTNSYHGLVQYKVLMHSSNNGRWTDLSKGYTDELKSEDTYKINTGKLSAGNYKIAVRVKKAWDKGSKSDNLGDYDTSEVIEFSVLKKPIPPKKPTQPSSKYPPAPKIEPLYVGNDSEITKIRVRKGPSLNTDIAGHIYGSTQEIKVLGRSGDFYKVQATDYDSLNTINGYIKSNYVKKVIPNNRYSILVSLANQKVYIYENNKLIKSFICSTGMRGTPTIKGRFLIGGRGASFGQEHGYICYNFIRFNYDYLFHSVLHNLDGSIIQSEYNKLGTQASHGCVRLKDEDIKWMYNNIPRNTLVVIQ